MTKNNQFAPEVRHRAITCRIPCRAEKENFKMWLLVKFIPVCGVGQ
jgi:hypothetical protein